MPFPFGYSRNRNLSYQQLLADRPPILTSQFIRYMLGATAEQIGEFADDDTPSPLPEPLSPSHRVSLFTSTINHARRMLRYIFSSSNEDSRDAEPIALQNIVIQEVFGLPAENTFHFRLVRSPTDSDRNYIIPQTSLAFRMPISQVQRIINPPQIREEAANAYTLKLEELKFPADSVPKYMICPISYQIMIDPVFTVESNGAIITFDYDSIKRCLDSNGLHPYTKRSLTIDDLIPHPRLRASINRFLTHATPENSAVCLQRFFRARREYKLLRDAKLNKMTDDQKIAYKNGLKLFQIEGLDKDQLNGLRVGLTHKEVKHPNYSGSIADLVEQGFKFSDVIGFNEKQQARTLYEYDKLLAKSKLTRKYYALPKPGFSKEQLRHPNFNATVAQLVEHGFKFNQAIQLNPHKQEAALRDCDQNLIASCPRPR